MPLKNMANSSSVPTFSESLYTTSEGNDNGTTSTTSFTATEEIITTREAIPTTYTPLTTESQDSSVSVGVLVGGIVGGLTVIVVFTLLIVLLIKKRNKLSCCHKTESIRPPIAPSISTVNFNQRARVEHQTSYTSETALMGSPGFSWNDMRYSSDSQQDLPGLNTSECQSGDQAMFTITDEDEDQVSQDGPDMPIENEKALIKDDHRMNKQMDNSGGDSSEPYDVLPPTRQRHGDSGGDNPEEVYVRPEGSQVQKSETVVEDTYGLSNPDGDTYDMLESQSEMPFIKTEGSSSLPMKDTSACDASPIKKIPTYANLPKVHQPATSEKESNGNQEKDTTSDIITTRTPEDLTCNASITESNYIGMSKVQNFIPKPKSECSDHRQDIVPELMSKDPSYGNFETVKEFQLSLKQRNS